MVLRMVFGFNFSSSKGKFFERTVYC